MWRLIRVGLRASLERERERERCLHTQWHGVDLDLNPSFLWGVNGKPPPNHQTAGPKPQVVWEAESAVEKGAVGLHVKRERWPGQDHAVL